MYEKRQSKWTGIHSFIITSRNIANKHSIKYKMIKVISGKNYYKNPNALRPKSIGKNCGEQNEV